MAERTAYWFEVYVDTSAEWRWRFWAPDGEKMADSGKGYKRRQDCVAAIGRLMSEANDGVTIVG